MNLTFKQRSVQPLNLKQKPKVFRIRDLKGAEGGAQWSASGMEHGSEANPGKARPRAKRGGMPKNNE
ncbi:MAG: hypothetical protein CVU04_02910 [Bacteroidetes bacterium HGW-Bacteroidetes-20]|nr:MAG: hypothetical protein CVU04_02910 [Bacteroidetes bacterium HGW-Bacteroidetes-20]